MSRLERLAYYTKYTAGSYADAFMSIPIWSAEKVSKGAGYICDKLDRELPEFLSYENTKDKSPVYRTRERLRDSLDTRAGALFLQSNAVATLPFFLVGMPVAELAQSAIDSWFPDLPEVAKFVTNSVVTLTAQMATAYAVFMANEVRVNAEKYVDENEKYSAKKIVSGLFKAMKAFLSFDLTYSSLKIGGQTYFLYAGKDPWKASAFADTIATPAYWTFAIPLGLRMGIIETEQTKEWDLQDS